MRCGGRQLMPGGRVAAATVGHPARSVHKPLSDEQDSCREPARGHTVAKDQLLDQSSADGEDLDLSSESKKEFQVSISGLSVTVTCPKEGVLTKKLTDDDKRGDKSETHVLDNYSSDQNGLYRCDKDYLYLHAYVCETCAEVTVARLAIFVIADCLITIGVCLTVYMFCKRTPGQVRESGYTKGARNKGNKERPPPVPNPDYEPIQKRRQDVYDGLNQGLK